MPQIKEILMNLKETGFSMPERLVAIYLYGSSMTGRLRVESDIDIAILPSYQTSGGERLILISKVESIIAKLLGEKGIRREISIVNLRDKFLSLTLQYKIITEGLLLYEKEPMERLEFENAVKREYFDFAPYLSLFRKRKYGDLHSKV
jgi:predicted nucleotidyltransferase